MFGLCATRLILLLIISWNMILISYVLLKTGNDAATIAAITPDGYDFRHLPRRNRRGGGVGILYKTTFHLCSLTHLPAKTIEGIAVVLRVRPTSTVRIVTIYRPPSSGKNTTPFSVFITEFSHVLDRAATRFYRVCHSR